MGSEDSTEEAITAPPCPAPRPSSQPFNPLDSGPLAHSWDPFSAEMVLYLSSSLQLGAPIGPVSCAREQPQIPSVGYTAQFLSRLTFRS